MRKEIFIPKVVDKLYMDNLINELEKDLKKNTYPESIESLSLIDKSHTCTCPWFYWYKKTNCVVHPKKLDKTS